MSEGIGGLHFFARGFTARHKMIYPLLACFVLQAIPVCAETSQRTLITSLEEIIR